MGRVIWLEPDAAGDSSLYDSLGYLSYEIVNIYYCQEMQIQKSESNNHIPQAPPKTKHHWSSFPPRIPSHWSCKAPDPWFLPELKQSMIDTQ